MPDHIRVQSGQLIGGDKDDMVSNRNHYVIDDLPPDAAHLREGATFVIEPIEGIPRNYAALKVTENYKKACAATGTPLRYDYIFNSTVTTEGMTSRMRTVPGQPAEVHGPCVTVVNEQMPLLDRDDCAAVVFDGWPDVARGWAGRPRPSHWPPPDAIGEIVHGGFHMVPVGVSTDTEKRRREWRYSFSMAEQRLAKHYLPDVARKVYIYLKMLRSHYFDLPSVLPTYFMKTFFFWLCERRPRVFWDDSKMADVLHHVIDELLHAIARREIRHYFIRDVNLLDGLQASFASDLVAKICRVRLNLVSCLLQIDDRVTFIGLLNRRKARVLLAAPLAAMTINDAVTANDVMTANNVITTNDAMTANDVRTANDTMTANDLAESAARFDRSRRVALDAMFTETLSVLTQIADAAEGHSDPLRLLYDINVNTFMRIVYSLLFEAHHLDDSRLPLAEYLLSTLLHRTVSAALVARFMCLLTTATESERVNDLGTATLTTSAVIARLYERPLSADVRQKLDNAVCIFRDTNRDDSEFNNMLLYRKFYRFVRERNMAE